MQYLESSSRKALPHKAFTLVEMVALIAVVTILVALLLPVFSTIKMKGQRATCQGNLKQIGLAIRQYVLDHDSRYPQLTEWKTAVVSYAKTPQILECPTDRIPFNPSIYLAPPYPSNYSYNRYLDEGRRGTAVIPNLGGVNEAIIPKASLIILGADLDIDGPKSSGTTACGDYELPLIHQGGANYSFCDGHVKWLTPRRAAEMNCRGMAP